LNVQSLLLVVVLQLGSSSPDKPLCQPRHLLQVGTYNSVCGYPVSRAILTWIGCTSVDEWLIVVSASRSSGRVFYPFSGANPFPLGA